jgi:ketosteroid isomerase-like protein
MSAIQAAARVTAAALFACTLLAGASALGEDSLDTGKLKAANALFETALSKRDIAALDSICAKDERVTALHPPSKAVIVGWTAVRKSWEGAFANFPEMSVEMKDPSVRIAGNMAVVTGTETFRGKRPNGDVVEFLAPTTNVYERHGNEWLLVHHHAGRAPQ